MTPDICISFNCRYFRQGYCMKSLQELPATSNEDISFIVNQEFVVPNGCPYILEITLNEN